jgi:hypothetical protein
MLALPRGPGGIRGLVNIAMGCQVCRQQQLNDRGRDQQAPLHFGVSPRQLTSTYGTCLPGLGVPDVLFPNVSLFAGGGVYIVFLPPDFLFVDPAGSIDQVKRQDRVSSFLYKILHLQIVL